MAHGELERPSEPVALASGVFYPDRHEVVCAGTIIRLSPMESRLLAFLAASPGRTWSPEELLRQVWGYNPRVTSRTAYTTISRLRARVEPNPDHPVHILSAPGAGYRFAPLAPEPVEAAQPEAPANPRFGFVGREVEIRELHQRISAGARRLALVGVGGVGKTRLARRYLERHGEEFEGCAFCELADCTTEAELARQVALALGLDIVSQDAVEQVAQVLVARGRILVVLDNLEQLGRKVDRSLDRWQAAAPDAVLLLTSRLRHGLSEGEVLPVEPLPLEQGVDLFRLRAQARRELSATEADEAVLREIVAALDALPLAIELAATRVAVLSIGGIRDRLVQRFRLLASLDGGVRRHATLGAVLDWSWELLQPWERAALAQISCFVGGFTLAAAEAVLDLSPWPEAPWPLDVLHALVNHSLLRVTHDPEDDPRFSLLQSIQDYAAVRMARSPEPGDPPWSGTDALRAVEARHGRYYASYADSRHFDEIRRYAAPRQQRRLYAEHPNFVAAVQRAVARGDGDVAVSTALIARYNVLRRGPFQEAVDLLTAVLPLAPANLRLIVRAELASALSDTGRLAEAEALGLAVEQEARLEGLIEVETQATMAALAARWQAHADDVVVERAEALVARCVELDVRDDLGVALSMLATVLQEHGRRDEALRIYPRALEAHEAVGNRHGMAVVHGNMANLYRDTGRLELASEHYKRACELHAEGGNRRRLAVVQSNLAGLLTLRGELDEARALFESVLAEHRQVGNHRSHAFASYGYARVLLLLDLLPVAGAVIAAGLESAIRAGNSRAQAAIGVLQANCRLREGDAAQAAAIARRAVAGLRSCGDPVLEALGQAILGLALAHLDERDAAKEAWAAVRAYTGLQSHPADRVEAACREAEGLAVLGEGQAAWARLEEVRDWISDLPQRSVIRMELDRAVARVRAQVGDPPVYDL